MKEQPWAVVVEMDEGVSQVVIFETEGEANSYANRIKQITEPYIQELGAWDYYPQVRQVVRPSNILIAIDHRLRAYFGNEEE